MKYNYEHEQIEPEIGLSFKYYLCTVQQNPLHWHKEIELIYCVKGKLQIETLDRKITLRAGDIVLINKNSVHQILGEDNENVNIILQFDLEEVEKYVFDIEKYTFRCDSIMMGSQNFLRLKELIHDIIVTLAKKNDGYLLQIAAIRNYLILELLHSFKCERTEISNDVASDLTLDRLSKIIKYIEENFKDSVSLEQIAKNHFLSTYYLSHYFHEKMGISFRRYLTYTRVFHAREMLLNSSKRIIDIALECGFSDGQSFSKAFKNEFGKAPGKYRDEILINENARPNQSRMSGHSWIPVSPQEILEIMNGI